ncbi:hypothetical protein Barb6XT_02837 [Bacteroidales bacterium Barb6XT]|nr:hypothetical protein Barb6XT_02837 [Bacteroidales bacterium Barb6XT]
MKDTLLRKTYFPFLELIKNHIVRPLTLPTLNDVLRLRQYIFTYPFQKKVIIALSLFQIMQIPFKETCFFNEFRFCSLSYYRRYNCRSHGSRCSYTHTCNYRFLDGTVFGRCALKKLHRQGLISPDRAAAPQG